MKGPTVAQVTLLSAALAVLIVISNVNRIDTDLVRKGTPSGRWSSRPGFERPELRTNRTPGYRSRTTLANAMPFIDPDISISVRTA